VDSGGWAWEHTCVSMPSRLHVSVVGLCQGKVSCGWFEIHGIYIYELLIT
jgi:hypothetical protein